MKTGWMRRMGWVLATATALLAFAPRAVTAQHEMPALVVIDASDPAAKRAAGLVELLVAGERDKAESYLKEHVAPGDLARVTGEIQPLLALLGSGGFRLRDFVKGPEEGWVVARLVGASAEPELIGLLITQAAPHRIQRLFHVRMQHG